MAVILRDVQLDRRQLSDLVSTRLRVVGQRFRMQSRSTTLALVRHTLDDPVHGVRREFTAGNPAIPFLSARFASERRSLGSIRWQIGAGPARRRVVSAAERLWPADRSSAPGEPRGRDSLERECSQTVESQTATAESSPKTYKLLTGETRVRPRQSLLVRQQIAVKPPILWWGPRPIGVVREPTPPFPLIL